MILVLPHISWKTKQEPLTRHRSEVSAMAEQFCNSKTFQDIFQINFLFYCEPGERNRKLQKSEWKQIKPKLKIKISS